MSLVVEDGTGLSNAEAYASVSDVRAYATARGLSLPEADGDVEALIRKGCDYLEQYDFKGRKVSRAQALSWPRSYVEDPDYPGEYLATDEVPKRIVFAQCQAAIDASSVELMPTTDGRVVSSEKVDVLEVSYEASSGAAPRPVLSRVSSLIGPLLSSDSGFSLSTKRV